MIRTNSMMHSIVFAVLLITAMAITAKQTMGQDSPTLQKFVTSDVVGIGFVDLDSINLNETFELLKKMGFDEGVSFERMQDNLKLANDNISKLKEAGINKGYVLMRASDFQTMGTSFVFPLKRDADSEKAKAAFDTVFEQFTGGQPLDYKSAIQDGAVVCSPTGNLQTLGSNESRNSADQSEMWKTVKGQSIGLLLFGDDDSRKVISELMPQLPGSFAKITGELVAEKTNWVTASLKLDAAPDFELMIDTKDEASAKVYKDAIDDALKMAKFLPQVREMIPKSEVKFVFNAIAPKQNGNRVTISADKLTSDLERLTKVAAQPLRNARKAARRTQMLNNLRQNMLAVLNYESAYTHFPSQYSVDDDGKPLLSWRVHVLPFLQQNELYKQFKLNEPWDSEHNIKLVEKMPDIFADLRAGGLANNKAGKTAILAPAGKGLVFDADAKRSFGDLTDGSSNTISLVCAPAEIAVPWTKPQDWDVDMDSPGADLEVEGFSELLVVLFDGSTLGIKLPHPNEELKKLIGSKDGGVVDWKLLDGRY